MRRIIRKINILFGKFKRHLKNRKFVYNYKRRDSMKINIVANKEAGWILYKFAKSVCDVLLEMGYDARISEEYDKSCDINHYFTPGYVGINKYMKADSHCSFMITHVDTASKLSEIIDLTNKGALGICMSKETRDRLIAGGVKPNRICYVNPAQDGQLHPRKIVLGFTNRVYNDNRKRDSIIVDVFKRVDGKQFKVAIMGSGWDEIIKQLNELGVETEYYPDFDKAKYNGLMMNLDYYCYFGTDEGSMGFLDAIAAGKGTIVTPQGYHLDAKDGITYPVNTVDEIVDVLNKLAAKNERSYSLLNLWTWKKYTEKHLELWKYILECETLDVLLANRGNYEDGIFSLMVDDLGYLRSLSQFLGIKK